MLLGPAASLADAYARKGAPIILRRLSRTDGPNPIINPPRVTGAVVAGDVAAGATSMALGAVSAVGRLLPGDKIIAGGVTLTVASIAQAGPVMTPGFAAVTIEPAPASVALATPALFSFAADLPTFGMIEGFPLHLVDGERIQSTDLRVQIPALGLPTEIPATWSLILNGREMSIIGSLPTYLRGDVMTFMLQART